MVKLFQSLRHRAWRTARSFFSEAPVGDLLSMAARQMSFLESHGFTVTRRPQFVTFTSDKYVYVLIQESCGQVPSAHLYSRWTGNELASPLEALRYYDAGYSGKRRIAENGWCDKPDAERAIHVDGALLSQNSWVFTDIRWPHDRQFLTAVEEARRWQLRHMREGRLPSHDETTAWLAAHRRSIKYITAPAAPPYAAPLRTLQEAGQAA